MKPATASDGVPSSTIPADPPALRTGSYRRVGLTGNPFRVLAPDEIVDRLIDPADLARAEQALRSGARVIEVVGHSGWGKSTRLAVLQYLGETVLGERWVRSYVEPGANRARRPAGPFERWCIDEAQRITRRRLRRIVQRAARGDFRIVLGTHVSFEASCEQPRSTFMSLRLSSPTAETIERFIHTRVAAVLPAGHSVPQVSRAALALLDRQTAGNLHRVEEVLYEVFQHYVDGGRLPGSISEADIALAIRARPLDS